MNIIYSPVITAPLPFLLANSHLLQLLEEREFHQPISEREVEEAIYLNYHQWQSRHPDHIFRNRWLALCSEQGAGAGNWVLPALVTLIDSYLYFRHEKLHVYLETYGEWQNLLSRISSLPIQAAAYSRSRISPATSSRSKAGNADILIYPYDSVVEDYIAHEGLHETHLHLNGSTYAEVCWLRALTRPKRELIDFTDKYHKDPLVRELCHSINVRLNPEKLYTWLLLARRLRSWLIAIADGRAEQLDAKEDKNNTAPINVHQLIEFEAQFSEDGLPSFELDDQFINAETTWLVKIFAHLHRKSDPLADRLLHLYLLIQNQYLQLVVQREDMYGFDQFQKITMTDLREPIEKKYFNRFRQMSGPNLQLSRVDWFEGRFAPKNTVDENSRILKSILGGYLSYLRFQQSRGLSTLSESHSLSKILSSLTELVPEINENGIRNHLKLALVIHFIKQPWISKKEGYRHAKLRHKLEKQNRVLFQTLKRWPLLSHWIRGVDAAANEIHASPEVFAPFFRVCHRQGLIHKTYHVGEDFTHLISGIRSVADALELLELGAGDRIGHGTALGIDPALWLSSVPRKLLIKRGDWMLDLLGAWRYLRHHPATQQVANKLSSEIADLAYRIFKTPLTCETVDIVMRHRGLLPRFVFSCIDDKDQWHWQTASVDDAWREEARLVYEAQNQIDLELLARWWRDSEIINRSEVLIEVDSHYLKTDALIILQQCAMSDLQTRRIVIEILPTSNVRISQYEHYRDHHSLRWMKVDGFVKEGDPNILLSLGADDPGIFSNDLYCDFYQLYAVMREAGLSDIDALNKIAIVNERGRQYCFHDKNIWGYSRHN